MGERSLDKRNFENYLQDAEWYNIFFNSYKICDIFPVVRLVLAVLPS